MYTVSVVARHCSHCGRGEETLYAQLFRVHGQFRVAGFDIEELHGRSAAECREQISKILVCLVSDPKKHRKMMPSNMPYEEMLKLLTEVSDALSVNPNCDMKIIPDLDGDLPF